LRALLEGDRASSLPSIRRAAEIAPGSKAVYNNAYSAIELNRPREAINSLLKLDPERGPMRGWAHYWNVLAEAYHMLGEHKKELKAVRSGLKQYPDSFTLHGREVYALAALGKIDEMRRLWISLDVAFPMPRSSAGRRRAALEWRAHGHPEMAADFLNDIIEWYEVRPAEEKTTHRRDLAITLYYAERWEDSRTIFEEINIEYPDSLNVWLGCLAARRGDRGEALLRINRLTEIHGTNKYDYGTLQHNQARIYALLGEKEQAVNLLQEAFRKGNYYGIWLSRDFDLESLRGFPAFEEFARPKG